jgi:hypothetical protein
VNPIDWIAWIYGKFFADHPILGGVVFCFGASAIMLLLYLRAIDKYHDDHPLAPVVRDKPPQPEVPPPQPKAEEKPRTEHAPKPVRREPKAEGPAATPQTTPSAILLSDTEKLVLFRALKSSAGNQISLITVGGTDSSALSSQIKEAFELAEWQVSQSFIGSLNITVVGDAGGGRVDVHGLYLIALHPDDPAVQTIVSGFEMARHPVSLNGSRVLRPRGEITLYVALDNKTL